MMTYVKFENEKQLLCTLLENTDFSGIKNTRTHWLWEQLRLLLTGQLHVDHEDKEIAMFEFNSHGELDSLPSPRALNTHLWFTQFPAEVRKKGTKLVVLYRNPKDVCVSWYVLHRQGSWYEYKGEFRNWIRPFLEGNVDWGAYSEWLMQWERMMEQHPDHPVHVLSYEDLKKNPVEELTKLSGFLDKDHDLDFLQAVSDACAH
nr:hypothetical protein BaRGS_007815 [Batillaria attramentaria]